MERDDVEPEVIVVSTPTVKLPTIGGGQIVVEDLKPGERRKVAFNGRTVVVYRPHVH